MSKRLLQVVFVCLFAVTMLGAGTPNASFDKIGHKLVCTCSCGQILVECNHVNCPNSGPMIDELRTQLAANNSEAAILQNFIAKYGPVVLAAPIRGGFDNVAWIVPYASFFIASIGVVILIRYWHQRNTKFNSTIIQAESQSSVSEEIRIRIHRETNYDD